MVTASARVDRTSKGSTSGAKEVPQNGRSRSLEIAQGGIETSGDFTSLMSALMGDLLEGAVDASVGNAVVNAGGKLLKVVELRLKYGTKAQAPGLQLIG